MSIDGASLTVIDVVPPAASASSSAADAIAAASPSRAHAVPRRLGTPSLIPGLLEDSNPGAGGDDDHEHGGEGDRSGAPQRRRSAAGR